MTTEQKNLYKNSKCANYQVANACMQCKKGFYFSKENDQCLKCETDEKCAYCDFKDPTRCIMCNSEYFMTVQPNNQCIPNSNLDVTETVQEEVIPDIYIVKDSIMILRLIFVTLIGLIWV